MTEVMGLFLPLGFAILAQLLVIVMLDLFSAAIQFMVEAFKQNF